MDKKTFPSDAADKFVLRLPEGMRERIAESAKLSGRSMNAEIVARLTQSFEPAEPSGRHVPLLIDRYETDLAEAEVDKHSLYLMLQQVVFEHRTMAATLSTQNETIPEAKQTFSEWQTEALEVLNEAQGMLNCSIDDALQRLRDATERLAKHVQNRQASAQRTLEVAKELAAKPQRKPPEIPEIVF